MCLSPEAEASMRILNKKKKKSPQFCFLSTVEALELTSCCEYKYPWEWQSG